MALANKVQGQRNTTLWSLIITGLVLWFSRVVGAISARLTRKRITAYLPVPFTVLWIPYLSRHASGDFPHTSKSVFFESDFLAYYIAGNFALRGSMENLYSIAGQYEMQLRLLSDMGGDEMSLYISPPVVTYVYAPFSTLPYLWAAVSWITLTIILLAWSVRLIWPLVPNLHSFGFARVLAVVLMSFPVVDLIASGQNSAVTLLLMTVGLRLLLAARPVAAGAVLGLGVFKPQLFILFPLLMAFERRWRAAASWTFVAISLTAVSLWLVGVDGARSYVALLSSDLYHEEILGDFGWKMNTVGSLLRSLFPPALFTGTIVTLGNVIVLAIGALLLAKVHQQVRRSTTGTDALTLSYALTVLISATFAPHVFNYDSILLILPIMILLDRFPTSAALKVSIASAYVISLTTPLRSVAFSDSSWPATLLAAPWAVVPMVACAFIALQGLSDNREVHLNESPLARTVHATTGN